MLLQTLPQLRGVGFIGAGDGPNPALEKVLECGSESPGTFEQARNAIRLLGGQGERFRDFCCAAALQCGGFFQEGGKQLAPDTLM